MQPGESCGALGRRVTLGAEAHVEPVWDGVTRRARCWGSGCSCSLENNIYMCALWEALSFGHWNF